MLDETKTYVVPMIKNGDLHGETPIEVETIFDKRGITCKKEGYQNKYFYKEFFEWLIYRGYIKVKGE